uniref:Uncharacterized protein ORF8 n=1 Tax=Methanothermobacter thermautotrophicus TaxID=145262 RepID=YPV8_METTF|nr:RecName: Full=Uncharacterized protein ORF8 [Methanothermobacter thermautotrophicus]CAA48425.1 unnamed protein product [Methanothermobacter thermautotrophicus]
MPVNPPPTTPTDNLNFNKTVEFKFPQELGKPPLRKGVAPKLLLGHLVVLPIYLSGGTPMGGHDGIQEDLLIVPQLLDTTPDKLNLNLISRHPDVRLTYNTLKLPYRNIRRKAEEVKGIPGVPVTLGRERRTQWHNVVFQDTVVKRHLNPVVQDLLKLRGAVRGETDSPWLKRGYDPRVADHIHYGQLVGKTHNAHIRLPRKVVEEFIPVPGKSLIDLVHDNYHLALRGPFPNLLHNVQEPKTASGGPGNGRCDLVGSAVRNDILNYRVTGVLLEFVDHILRRDSLPRSWGPYNQQVGWGGAVEDVPQVLADSTHLFLSVLQGVRHKERAEDIPVFEKSRSLLKHLQLPAIQLYNSKPHFYM